MGTKSDLLKGYQRQLIAQRIPAEVRVWLGPDDFEDWAAERVYFAANWNLRLLPTGGVMQGSRGIAMPFGRLTRPQNSFEMKALDYDEILVQQLYDWQYLFTDLRLYVWGTLWARCNILGVPIDRPRTKELVVQFACRQLYLYKENAPAEKLNDPFTADPAYGYSYGMVAS
jgi:hypothetical protein